MMAFQPILSIILATLGAAAYAAEPDIQVTSAQDVSEYKPIGAPPHHLFEPGKDSRLFLVKMMARPKVEEVTAVLIDADDHRYKTLFRQVMQFDDGRTEAELLFEVPTKATLRMVEVNGRPLKLPKKQ